MALLSLRRSAAAAILCGLIGLTFAVAAHPAAADVGFSDASFSGTSAPTGMKPQSKLWYADGAWWGGLFVSSGSGSGGSHYNIFKFNPGTHAWVLCIRT